MQRLAVREVNIDSLAGLNLDSTRGYESDRLVTLRGEKHCYFSNRKGGIGKFSNITGVAVRALPMRHVPSLTRLIKRSIIVISLGFKDPYPGKWHVFVLALLYLFECLNE